MGSCGVRRLGLVHLLRKAFDAKDFNQETGEDCPSPVLQPDTALTHIHLQQHLLNTSACGFLASQSASDADPEVRKAMQQASQGRPQPKPLLLPSSTAVKPWIYEVFEKKQKQSLD